MNAISRATRLMPHETSYTLYDLLLLLPIYVCRAKRHPFTSHRATCMDDPDAMRNRPAVVVLHDAMVLLRGEESRVLGAYQALTDKMRVWNVLFYGTLPYILGYSASGRHL